MLTGEIRSQVDRIWDAFWSGGISNPLEVIEQAKSDATGLGVFVRSLVGLDREAAKGAFWAFTAGGTLTANHIEFVNLVVDHLCEHGVLDAAVMYDSPFTDVAPRGPDGLFTSRQWDEMREILSGVRSAAIPM